MTKQEVDLIMQRSSPRMDGKLNSPTPSFEKQNSDMTMRHHCTSGSISGSIVVQLNTNIVGFPSECHNDSPTPLSFSKLTSPALWRRLLFIVHLCFIVYSLSVMLVVSGRASRNIYKRLEGIEKPFSLLALLGFVGIDRSDPQWNAFSQLALPFIPLILVFVSISSHIRHSASQTLQCYYVSTGIAFFAFLHGPIFFLPLSFMGLNYIFAYQCICFRIPYPVFMAAMWTSQVGLLLITVLYGDSILPFTLPDIQWWPQRMPWGTVFNMCILRMISFNTDFYDAAHDGLTKQELAVRKHDSVCLECVQMQEAKSGDGGASTRCYKFRTEYPRNLREYNLLGYMAYMLYVPLYVAGPMSSFNAFVSHCNHPTLVMSLPKVALYALRVVGLYVIVTLFQHVSFVNAVRNDSEFFASASSLEVISMYYLHYVFLWLKFSCVWKFFRLIALLDGVDVPEDMPRCFNSVVSIQGFWRDWHASFNLWIVRYMYVPLGGSKNKHLSIFPIFFFIAIWHELELRLLYWALSMICWILVELLISHYTSANHCVTAIQKSRPVLYFVLRGVAAACSHAVVIFGCIIGFTAQSEYDLGLTVGAVFFRVFFQSHVLFVPWFFFFFYCSSQVAIERCSYEEEKIRLERSRLFLSE